jgi:acetyl-CoA carboxylase biotin carboxyl carrier protein
VTDRESQKPLDRLQEYFQLMEEENLQELEIREADFTIKLVRRSKPHGSPAHPPASGALNSPPEPLQNRLVVTAPLAGVFYRAPSPQANPYVNAGDTINPGQLLCIIEAMKIMNEIRSELGGRVTKILVENGKVVKAGQELFLVEPA